MPLHLFLKRLFEGIAADITASFTGIIAVLLRKLVAIVENYFLLIVIIFSLFPNSSH